MITAHLNSSVCTECSGWMSISSAAQGLDEQVTTRRATSSCTLREGQSPSGDRRRRMPLATACGWRRSARTLDTPAWRRRQGGLARRARMSMRSQTTAWQTTLAQRPREHTTLVGMICFSTSYRIRSVVARALLVFGTQLFSAQTLRITGRS